MNFFNKDIANLLCTEECSKQYDNPSENRLKFTAPALRMESIAHAPSEGAPVVDWGWNYDIWERGRHKPNTKNIKVFVQGLRKIRLIRDHDKDLIR